MLCCCCFEKGFYIFGNAVPHILLCTWRIFLNRLGSRKKMWKFWNLVSKWNNVYRSSSKTKQRKQIFPEKMEFLPVNNRRVENTPIQTTSSCCLEENTNDVFFLDCSTFSWAHSYSFVDACLHFHEIRTSGGNLLF